jgi:hypothetical protein
MKMAERVLGFTTREAVGLIPSPVRKTLEAQFVDDQPNHPPRILTGIVPSRKEQTPDRETPFP